MIATRRYRYGWVNDCKIVEYKRSLDKPTVMARLLKKKGMTGCNKKAAEKLYRGAVTTCSVKIRHSLPMALWQALIIGNFIYHCAVCEHWHTSRQSPLANRRKHGR